MTRPSTVPQGLARRLRRAPGYDWALREVLPRVRRNALLTDLAWRVFAPRHGAGQVDVPLHAGRYVSGPDTDLLPVIGFLAVDLTAPQAEELVDRVATLQRAYPSFRPLLVLDQPVFAAAREHGFVVEHVAPRGTLVHAPASGATWESYLADRVAGIVDHYQLWHLVRTDQGQIHQVDEEIVRSLRHRLPPGLEVEGGTAHTAPGPDPSPDPDHDHDHDHDHDQGEPRP